MGRYSEAIKMNTIIKFSFILITSLLPFGMLAQNILKDIGEYDENAISTLSLKYEVPLVIIANRVYLPDLDCLDVRRISGDIEDRKLGGDIEDRKLGGDVENRKLGGDVENRKLGGDVENRKLGGDVENRKLGGDVENRKLGGDVENRKLGGDVEDRKLGGDITELICVKLKEQNGFSIKNANPNAEVLYYYRGKLYKSNNMLILY